MNAALRRIWLRLLLGCCAFAASAAHAAPSVEDFWIAIRNDRPGPVKELLARGFDPNTPNEASNTPLMETIKASAWQVYPVLLADKRIDLNRRNLLAESPLMYLAILGETARMETLIQRGAEVNSTGWTPLHYAASRGHADSVRLLIEHHAYIDAESPGKLTPLMMAAIYNHAGTVKLLLDEGADAYVRNADGKNAVELAREKGNTRLANDMAERLNRERTLRDMRAGNRR